MRKVTCVIEQGEEPPNNDYIWPMRITKNDRYDNIKDNTKEIKALKEKPQY